MDQLGVTIGDAASAFAFLGDEVRFAILESLYDRTAEAGPLTTSATYSQIREDAGVADSGRFSYHLDKLTGPFIAKTDDGYRLRESGREVVKLYRTGILSSEPTVEPREIDVDCYRCGSTVRVGYDNGHLLTQCPECPGLFTRPGVPDGMLTALGYPPSGMWASGSTADPIDDGPGSGSTGDTAGGGTTDGRPGPAIDLNTAFERAHVRANGFVAMMGRGFCPRCGGDVTATLDPCRDHEADGVCDSCGLWHPAFTQLACEVCGQPRLTHPLHVVHDRPPVAGVLEEHGADRGWDRFAELMRWSTTVRETDVVVDAPAGDRFVVPIDDPTEVEKR